MSQVDNGSRFGASQSKVTGTTYQAVTDGIVIAYRDASSSAIIGVTDSNATPTATVYKSQCEDGRSSGLVMPVRAGDYWVVNGAMISLLWIPLS